MRTQEEDSILEKGKQASPAVSSQLAEQLAGFVAPLLLELDVLIDKRLVRTLLATLGVIIQFRNRANGLLLSELGAYLTSADQAPCRHQAVEQPATLHKWNYSLIEHFLWDPGTSQRVTQLLKMQGRGSCLLCGTRV